MITTKEFNGLEFNAFCQQQYDEGRRFLKNCGKPKNEIDNFFIEKHKTDVSIFGNMLDMKEAVKMLSLRDRAIEERKLLQSRLKALDKLLHEDQS